MTNDDADWAVTWSPVINERKFDLKLEQMFMHVETKFHS